MNKEKIIKILKTNVKLFNRWRRVFNIERVDLYRADLRGANLSEANLQGADLRRADFTGTDLSRSILNDPIKFLNKNFKKTNKGYIVYKSFNEVYIAPSNWIIEPNSTIKESDINTDIRESCGSGINVGTEDWCKDNCELKIWKCLIKFEWLKDVVVPLGTDGKIRTKKLKLLEVVE